MGIAMDKDHQNTCDDCVHAVYMTGFGVVICLREEKELGCEYSKASEEKLKDRFHAEQNRSY